MGLMEPMKSESAGTAPQREKCRLCACWLIADRSGENIALGVCAECNGRPEARKLGPKPSSIAARRSARNFTPADKSLIKQVSGFMAAPKLLQLLNERLFADLGPDVDPYTQEQLHEELSGAGAVGAEGGGDWAGLRQLLATARRAGTLSLISEETINDFAVVFSLTPAQLMRLKDVVLDTDNGEFQ